MKIIVAIIVFNRVHNIKLWLKAWRECEQNGAELIIIHNYCGSDKIKTLCEDAGITYIRRENTGFDMGAFQDICLERLNGFPNEWDALLWCADDTIPMIKDFITPYKNKLINAGVVCTDLSPYVKKHIRTTGFLITKEASRDIRWDIDPIITKEHCYQFEHRGANAFYDQMIKSHISVSAVDVREKTPLYDTGYLKKVQRGKEHSAVFPQSDKVVFICAVYNSYPQIISSLICQTHQNWEMILIHDGPCKTGIKDMVTDKRIRWIETARHSGNWGHSLRQYCLSNIDTLCPDADFIVVTNADNYHVPVYCEYMIKGFEVNPGAVASYCAEMVHSYVSWNVILCRLERGFIDCAGVMVRREIAEEVGWRDIESHSSDWTYFEDIIKKYGVDVWEKVKGCLLIHN